MNRRDEKTVTEIWIEGLRKKRAEAIEAGQYFDGTARDNIIAYRRPDDDVDTMPCECNP